MPTPTVIGNAIMLVAFLTIFRKAALKGSDRLRSQAGFTLIEVVMAAAVLVVGLIGLLGLLDVSVKASANTRAREGATNLARELLEDTHTIPYAQLIPTSIESQLQAMNGLSDGSSASGWQIERRGFAYTVKVSECAIDDPKDGLAKTHGSTFCPEQQEWKETKENEVVDNEPEDLKQITAEVSWTIRGHTSAVKQVATLTAAGQAIGLIATKLEITSAFNASAANSTATTPVITEATTKALTFSVSFPEGTSAIIWSLEGAKQEQLNTSSSKATSQSFSWTINESTQKIYVSDGTYQISAQTVDATGVIGPPISIPVRLIRGVPAAPKKVVGAFTNLYRNGSRTEVAELQWEADPERNVIGYRVSGPGKELVCPASLETLSTATSCIDFGFSGEPTERSYTVAALYRNASEEAVTEGTPASVTVTRSTSTAPHPPTNLVATKNADGSVTLKWTAPTSGTAPAFYRIYRESTNYTSRYGTTTLTEFTDSEAEGVHEYWVTAVSSNLAESTFLGPVSQ